MASANRIEHKTPVEDTRDVQLTLRYDEAVALVTLLYSKVGGAGTTRNRLDNIWRALNDSGIKIGNSTELYSGSVIAL